MKSSWPVCCSFCGCGGTTGSRSSLFGRAWDRVNRRRSLSFRRGRERTSASRRLTSLGRVFEPIRAASGAAPSLYFAGIYVRRLFGGRGRGLLSPAPVAFPTRRRHETEAHTAEFGSSGGRKTRLRRERRRRLRTILQVREVRPKTALRTPSSDVTIARNRKNRT